MVTGAFITDRSGKMVITLKSIDAETGRMRAIALTSYEKINKSKRDETAYRVGE